MQENIMSNWIANLVKRDGELCIEVEYGYGTSHRMNLIEVKFNKSEVRQLLKYMNYEYKNKYAKPSIVKIMNDYHLCVYRTEDGLYYDTMMKLINDE
jgi:hypothetical protein